MRNETENKWRATLSDWSIVLYPDIYKTTDTPEAVFAKLNCGRPVALFGRAKNDPRYNPDKSDAFADGHRLVTSPIVAVKNNDYHTEDTVYSLDETLKNTSFKEWCEKNQYKEVSLDIMLENQDNNQGGMLLRHICETCGKEELLTSSEGFDQGWDYPPKMGQFAIISPRTCGECGIQTTLWWEITCNKTPPNQLSERHQQTLRRILSEPRGIVPQEVDDD